jgi:DNA-binding NarL/FixJ family response regulator
VTGPGANPHAQDEVGLLERDEELGRLEASIDAARAGNGGLILIEGPAGIGKTALLAAAGRIAEERGLRRLAATATELDGELPFGAIRQLLEGHVRALAAGERRELLAGSASAAAAVLGLTEPVTASPGPAVAYGLHWLVANLAERDPLCLILDDAQWVDADSGRFLAFVAPRLAELPILFLVGSRSEADGLSTRLAGTASDPAARAIVPQALSPEACATVAAESWDGPVAPELASACHHASGGNPFYLWALLDELRREGAEPGPATAARVLSMGPHAVRRVIVARIEGLPPPAEAIARAVAVLGDDSTLGRVARLAEVGPVEAAAAVDRLVAATIVEDGEAVSFAHPIIRNVVHANITPRERADLHGRAAALLASEGAAAERCAAHLLPATPSGQVATVEILRVAAGQAIARGAPAAAVAYLRRALSEPPAGDTRDDVLVELGRAELTTDGAAAREHLQQALAGVEPSEERVAVVRLLVAAHHGVGEAGRVDRLLREEIATAAAIDGAPAASLESDLIMSLLTGLDGASIREAHERVERLAPASTGSSRSGRALLSCLAYSRLCRGAPVAEVVAPARRRLAAATESGPDAAPTADWLLAVGVLIRCGELDAAECAARAGIDAARASGSVYALAGAHWVLGAVSEARGRLREASAQLAVALRAAREFGAVAGVHTSLFALVDVEVQRGELATGRAALAAEGLDAGPVEAVATPGELLESRARLRLAEGDAAGALEDFERVAALARARGDLGPGMTRWRSGAALAHMRLGDDALARRLAREEVERARRFRAVRPLAAAVLVASRVEDGGARLELLDEAVELLDGSPFRLDHARALVERGAALRRAGERSAAREPLRDGLELARSSGAVPLAERAFEELRATGARPRKVLRTGVDALTPSEARVARLAASGMSNREIAQELFVSPRTVEFHLRQVFTKLEISSRTDLPRVLAG